MYTIEAKICDVNDPFKWGVFEDGKLIGCFASKEQAEHVKASLERKPEKQ